VYIYLSAKQRPSNRMVCWILSIIWKYTL